jgi:tetratricopeptide (TPR) repeat protein
MQKSGRFVLVHDHYLLSSTLRTEAGFALFSGVDVDLARHVYLYRFRSTHQPTSDSRFTGAPSQDESPSEILRALARLNHPGLQQILNVWKDERYTWAAAQAIDSDSLITWMQGLSGQRRSKILRAAMQAIDVLAALHENGFNHGTITAESFRISERGQLCLCDYIERAAQMLRPNLNQRSASSSNIDLKSEKAELEIGWKWQDIQGCARAFIDAIEALPRHLRRSRDRRLQRIVACFRRWSLAAYSASPDPWLEFRDELGRLARRETRRNWPIPVAAAFITGVLFVSTRESTLPTLNCEAPNSLWGSVDVDDLPVQDANPAGRELREKVVDDFRNYAELWTQAYQEICSFGPEFASRANADEKDREVLTCLLAQKNQFSHAVRNFQEGRVALAGQEIEGLDLLGTCVAQHSRAQVNPMVRDIQARHAIAALRRRLDEAKKRDESPTQTISSLLPLQSDARRERHVSARFFIELATLALRIGDPIRGVPWALQAYLDATAAGDDSAIVESSILVLRTSALGQSRERLDHFDLKEASKVAAAEMRRFPRVGRERSRAYAFAQHVAALQEQEYKESIYWGERAINPETEGLALSLNQTLGVHNNLGIVFASLGEMTRATQHYQSALDMVEAGRLRDGHAACLLRVNIIELGTKIGHAARAIEEIDWIVDAAPRDQSCRFLMTPELWLTLALRAQDLGLDAAVPALVRFGFDSTQQAEYAGRRDEVSLAFSLLIDDNLPIAPLPLDRSRVSAIPSLQTAQTSRFAQWWLDWLFEQALVQKRMEDAQVIAETYKRWLTRPDNNSLGQGEAAACGVSARLAAASGDFSAAIESLEQSIAIKNRAYGTRSLDAVRDLVAASHYSALLGRWRESMDYADESLRRIEVQLAPQNLRNLRPLLQRFLAALVLNPLAAAPSDLEPVRACVDSMAATSRKEAWRELLNEVEALTNKSKPVDRVAARLHPSFRATHQLRSADAQPRTWAAKELEESALLVDLATQALRSPTIAHPGAGERLKGAAKNLH